VDDLVELGGIESLSNNSSVTHLIITWIFIGSDQEAKHVARAIQHNTRLLEVYLYDNKIGAQGAKNLAEAIMHNLTLQKIFIENNDIGQEGAEYLAEAIKQNTALQRINLGNNNIGDKGAEFVAEGIKHNTALLEMDLSFNNIGNEARFLAECLSQNTTLQEMGLSYNNIGDIELLLQISQLLEENVLIKERNQRKFVCAFSKVHKDLIRLGFDKMIVRFEYYPILGASFDEKQK
jgi:Ran GTPase-activating protein (RanGAP) involved in mRNA processing and transport